MKLRFRFGCATLVAALLLTAGAGHARSATCEATPGSSRELPSGSIGITGAVTETVYLNCEGDPSIDEALRLAGGLAQDAYPLGAMLFRRSSIVAGGQLEGPDSGASDTARLALEQLKGLPPYTATWKRSLIAQVQAELFARIPVVVDPMLQRQFPERVTDLAPGDVLFIPQRPTWVAVLGAVENPGLIPFDGQKIHSDYLEEAGGTVWGASKQRAFVYLPDGRKRDLKLSLWRYEPRNVPPGSVVVMPYRNGRLEP